MQVTMSEDVSPVEKKVAVEIPWPYVAQKLDEAYRDLGKGVALKGFRKGKVPRPILERMFGRQVEQEVVKQLVQESFVAAASKHDIQPVAEPIVDDAHLHKGSRSTTRRASRCARGRAEGLRRRRARAARGQGQRRGRRRARSSASARS